MKKSIVIQIICTFLVFSMLTSCHQKTPTEKQEKDYITNPISEIACADPSIVKYDEKYFIYATVDPWGGNELVVLESSDFQNWERKHIKWPNLKDCISPTSGDSHVWAPAVIQGKDSKFYMYVTVHNEIWAGVADHPLGPWKNAKKEGTPLIHGKMVSGFHMIDAEPFIDDNGQVYLYWGSGYDWKNGRCFVVELDDDMITFNKESIKDVTPPNYFEAPFMLKKDGKYHLMYSQGKCINSTYMVRSAVGMTPFGPWTEEPASPILTTTENSMTLGPGHHTVFQVGGQHYILYHRIRDNNNTLLRELAIDKMEFDDEGNIATVEPASRVEPFETNTMNIQ